MGKSTPQLTRFGRQISKPPRFIQSTSSETEESCLSDKGDEDDGCSEHSTTNEKTIEERNLEMDDAIKNMLEEVTDQMISGPQELNATESRLSNSSNLIRSSLNLLNQDPLKQTDLPNQETSQVNDNHITLSSAETESGTKPKLPRNNINGTSNMEQMLPTNISHRNDHSNPIIPKTVPSTAQPCERDCTNQRNKTSHHEDTSVLDPPAENDNVQYRRIETLIINSFKEIEQIQEQRMDNLEIMIQHEIQQRQPVIDEPNQQMNINVHNPNPRPQGFPFRSIIQFDNYQQEDNQVNQTQLTNYLVQLGGSSNCRDMIRRYYYKTFSSSIFKKFQWTSHNLRKRPEMRSLYKSKIARDFFNAVHTYQNQKKLTSTEFSDCMTKAIEAGKQSIRDSVKRQNANNPTPRKAYAATVVQNFGQYDHEENRRDQNAEDK